MTGELRKSGYLTVPVAPASARAVLAPAAVATAHHRASTSTPIGPALPSGPHSHRASTPIGPARPSGQHSHRARQPPPHDTGVGWPLLPSTAEGPGRSGDEPTGRLEIRSEERRGGE